ncbi:HET-domain-containing protein [Plenodomus tracheiphilus IPT5]|uniref:HET-domain-containing protein n=1 Tax=Plenodomus tracheiphilus IPT5 TaxID=1408161 RepID=A0A6A7AZB0_9PLEO|nr:HET-domain-containing protein [Plenodomus tracheiphilus IPT5]
MPAPSPLPTYLYKILPSAPPSPLPAGLPLSDLDRNDGYIHLSTAQQVPGTADSFFSSASELWLLKIKYDVLAAGTDGDGQVKAGSQADVRWEEVGRGCFPHLYGADLGKGNVESVDRVEKRGSWAESLSLPCGQLQVRADLSLFPQRCHICATIDYRLCAWNRGPHDLEKIVFRLTELSPEHIKMYIEWTAHAQHEDSIDIHLEPQTAAPTTDPNTSPCTDVDTCSPAATSFLRSKLHECLDSDKHAECQRVDTQIPLRYPTRLLSIKDRHEAKVILENTGPHTEGHYASLSHCWGKSRPFQLTSETEAILREGLNINQLPQTFRDAIQVCQSLDVPYIWIDSLCIFQDSVRDWQEQAALMSRVYTNAVCNIAATGAIDGTVGLNHSRSPLVDTPFHISAPRHFWRHADEQAPITYLVSYPMSFTLNLEDPAEAPLNRRAWVMQESLLSRRIMHFTTSGVYWQCLSTLSNQVYPNGLPQYFELLPKNDDKMLLAKGSALGASLVTVASRNLTYDVWNRICSDYSDKKLTVESDKLVAINGVAERVASLNRDNLIAGLWEQCLLPQLLWYLNQHHAPPRPFPNAWRAPSWSWASHNRNMRHAAHLSCNRGISMARVENIDVNSHASGQLRGERASLTLRGKVLFGHLSAHTDRPFFPYHHTKTSLVCGGRSKQIQLAMLDLSNHEPHDFQAEVLCFCVYEDTCDQKADEYEFWDWQMGSLILQKQRSEPDEYRRVGVLLLSEDESKFYAEHESSDEHSITII